MTYALGTQTIGAPVAVQVTSPSMRGVMSTDLQSRSLKFAARVARLVDALPRKTSGRVIADQIMRSAASIGAHSREARRARTKAEFVSKLSVALQEADETAYWLDLIAETGLVEALRLIALQDEIHQFQAILSASITTAKNGFSRTRS